MKLIFTKIIQTRYGFVNNRKFDYCLLRNSNQKTEKMKFTFLSVVSIAEITKLFRLFAATIKNDTYATISCKFQKLQSW